MRNVDDFYVFIEKVVKYFLNRKYIKINESYIYNEKITQKSFLRKKG